MMPFPVFSAVVLCLWSLILTSGPVHAPIFSIPALASPVLTPVLSPADGLAILILIDVCDVTVPITLPICDPSDVPLSPPSPPAVHGSQRTSQLMAGLLVLACAGIVSCTKGSTRLMDGSGSITSTPSDRSVHPPSASPFVPPFPSPPREAGPTVDRISLLKPGTPDPLRLQILTRNAGVGMPGRIFRPSSADSGYEGSPSLSRCITSEQYRSRLRAVTSAEINSSVPPGPLPAAELGLGGSGRGDTLLEGPSLTPLFNTHAYQGGWTSWVGADDPFSAIGFTDRDLAPLNLSGKGIAMPLKTPTGPDIKTPPLTPHPPQTCISGLSSAPRSTIFVPLGRTSVFYQKGSREARDAFLHLQAKRGYAAPSRSYCDPVSERKALSSESRANIQALRDILESKKATLRRLNEIRSAWVFPLDARSQASFDSPRPTKEGRINLDMSGLISPPMDAVAPLDVSGASYSTHPIKTALANGITRRSSSVAEASDDPASTSTDIGLRLLLEAIIERGERFQYMDTQVFCEATVSMDLTMGQAPSFLDDILDLPIRHTSLSMVVTKDQDTRPASCGPAPTIDAPPSDVLPGDVATMNEPSIPPFFDNPIPSPSTPPFGTPVSFLEAYGFLQDNLEPLVQRSSRPITAFEVHIAPDLLSSFSLDSLEIPGNVSLLMDQSAPPSSVGSPIPPSQDVISRVRTRKDAIRRYQVPLSTRGLGSISDDQSGRFDTSMSLGRIADFLDDIWTPPVYESSDRVGFTGNQGVDRWVPATTASPSTTHVPEDILSGGSSYS